VTTFFERYQSGEHIAVWQDLIALGTQVTTEPLLSDARAVAAETMRRARLNLETLVERLRVLDYRFINSVPIGTPESAAVLDAFEQRLTLPISVRAWYEHIGEVDFGGTHPKLAHARSHRFPANFFGNTPHVFRHISQIRLQERESADFVYPRYSHPFAVFAFKDATEGGHRWNLDTGTYIYSLHFGLSEVDQAGEAGVGGIWLDVKGPARIADVQLVNDEHTHVQPEFHRTYFVDYLRRVFAWGGFPGFAMYSSRDWGHPPMRLVEQLCEGLLPL